MRKQAVLSCLYWCLDQACQGREVSSLGSVSSPFRAYQQNKQSAVYPALSVARWSRTSEYDDPGSDRVRDLIWDESQAETSVIYSSIWKYSLKAHPVRSLASILTLFLHFKQMHKLWKLIFKSCWQILLWIRLSLRIVFLLVYSNGIYLGISKKRSYFCCNSHANLRV